MQITQALETNTAPRFSAHVLKMSRKELDERIRYLDRYLRSITPRVSIYAGLLKEHDECVQRLAGLTA